ncbi:hypothetical protein TU57_17015, partial [Bacillus cereus]
NDNWNIFLVFMLIKLKLKIINIHNLKLEISFLYDTNSQHEIKILYYNNVKKDKGGIYGKLFKIYALFN